VSERLAQPPANIVQVFLHVDDELVGGRRLIGRRRLDVILHLCDGVQPRDCTFQGCLNRWNRLRTSLQCKHRGEQGQIIFDAMTLLLEQQLQLLLSSESTLQGASQRFTEDSDEQAYDGENRDSNEMPYGVGLPIQLRSHGQDAQTRREKATSA